MRKYRYLLSLLLAATVVLAACGSDNSQATDTGVTLPDGSDAPTQDNADTSNADGETRETLPVPTTAPTEENSDDNSGQDGEDQANDDSGDNQDSNDQGDNNSANQGDDQNQQDDQTGDDQQDNNTEDQTGSTDGDTESETGSENSGDSDVGMVDYVLRGTITTDGDGAIPEGAVVKVSLHNTSERQSSDTEVISATYTDLTSFPIDYELAWTGSNLGNIKLNYVSATVTLDGKVIYDTESVVDVSPQESVVDFSVVRV